MTAHPSGVHPEGFHHRHTLRVRFVETDGLNDEIDAAYRTKYRRYVASIVDSIVSPQARAATLKLVPR